ncbi:hypothetical protein RF55_24623, partial [Lasius niger]
MLCPINYGNTPGMMIG